MLATVCLLAAGAVLLDLLDTGGVDTAGEAVVSGKAVLLMLVCILLATDIGTGSVGRVTERGSVEETTLVAAGFCSSNTG